MGFWGRLFGGHRSNANREVFEIEGDGDFEFDIVGEGRHQKTLMTIAGPKEPEGKRFLCKAVLVAEPDNKHDPNAVKCTINGRKVGYVPRQLAPRVKRMLKGRKVRVDALIVGGWDDGDGNTGHYGVKLDI